MMNKIVITTLFACSAFFGALAGNMLLVVPANNGLVSLGFDLMRVLPGKINMVCYKGEKSVETIEYFDRASNKWYFSTMDQWRRSSGLFASESIIVVGRSNAAMELCQNNSNPNVEIINPDGILYSDVVNAVHTFEPLSSKQWKRLSKLQGINLKVEPLQSRYDKKEKSQPSPTRLTNISTPTPSKPQDGLLRAPDSSEIAVVVPSTTVEAATKAEAELKAKAEAEAKAKAEAEAKAKAEAEVKALADAKAKAEAELKAKAEAEAKAKAEAEAKALADAKAKAEAEAKALADAKAKAEAEAKALADAKAKAEAELKAKAEAEAKALADAKAKAEAELKAKAEAEAKALADAKAKAEAELKAKAEAEAKALADAKAKAEAELKAKAEAEAKALADAKAKAEAELKAKAEAEAKALADAKAKAEAELKAKAEAEAKTLADAKAKAEAELKAKAEAEAKALADAKAKAEAELKAKAEAEAKAKAEAAAKEAMNTPPSNEKGSTLQEAIMKAKAEVEGATSGRKEIMHRTAQTKASGEPVELTPPPVNSVITVPALPEIISSPDVPKQEPVAPPTIVPEIPDLQVPDLPVKVIKVNTIQ